MGRSMWISPLAIFWSVWLITVGLYDLHLSMVLIYPTGTVTGVVSWIVIPFSLSVLLYLGCSSPSARGPQNLSATLGDWLERRLKIAFALWVSMTALEVWVSGGVPILWLIQGSAQGYVDFGIPSVHGLLNSLLLAIGLAEFALFALTRKRKHLWMPAFVVLWSLIAV